MANTVQVAISSLLEILADEYVEVYHPATLNLALLEHHLSVEYHSIIVVVLLPLLLVLLLLVVLVQQEVEIENCQEQEHQLLVMQVVGNVVMGDLLYVQRDTALHDF